MRLGLYVHIPFCRSLCHYCDFPRTLYDPDLAVEFVEALLLEIRRRAGLPSVRGAVVDTIYFGGGTPTCLPVELLGRIVEAIFENFEVLPGAEFTVEANPESATYELLSALRGMGANRISIGAQTFDPKILRAIGRIHTPEDVERAVEDARRAGFDNLNLDLIYGLPGQTVEGFLSDLDEALSLGPKHISLYALSLHEGTPLYERVSRGEASLPSDDEVAEMFEAARGRLGEEGFSHYEISNFALPGFECRHNLKYWLGEPYLGLGPGAWSFINGWRRGNVPDVREYVRLLREGREPVAEVQRPPRLRRASELLILGLRLVGGYDLRLLSRRYGRAILSEFLPELRALSEEGLLVLEEDVARLSERAIPVANRVWARLLRG